MNDSVRYICLLLVFCTSCSRKVAVDRSADVNIFERPPAPDDFSWKELDEVKISVLVPNKWIVTRLEEQGTICYKITKDKALTTGLTINIIRNVSEKMKDSSQRTGVKINALVYAAYHIDEYKDRSQKVLDEWTKQFAVFQGYGCEVIKDIDQVPYHIRTSAIANTKTDTMYIWLFGAPVDGWERAWQFGDKMLSPIMLSIDY